ncbi:MAG: PAS domain S-box protein [Lentimicrobium sp.]|nr:PAS domain S-box protein [Lentimicrobium sp.]
MTDQKGISFRLSVNLIDWINRCYSVTDENQDIEHYITGFLKNLSSLQGVFGSWLFKESIDNHEFDLLASFSNAHLGNEKSLTDSFRKSFRFANEPWEITSRKINVGQLPSEWTTDHPVDKLSVSILPGFNLDGKTILVIVAESSLSDLFAGALPVMFRNILETMKNRFNEDESFYRLIVENQNDLIVSVDYEGRFLFVSSSYCDLFGKKKDELIGHNFMPLVHPEDQELTAISIRQIDKPPHTSYHEQRAKTHDGWRWLAWSNKGIINKEGKIVSIFAIGRDITDQKKIEQELVESELKFQKAFRRSPNLMSITRLSDGLLYDVNDKFASLLKLSRDELFGKTTAELGMFQLASRDYIKSALELNGRVEDLELSIHTPDNEKIDGLFSAEIIELKGENCLVSSFQDITELRKAQHELEEYRIHLEGLVETRTARVREINKELDRFARSVSHDLKAPLRALQGFSNALMEDHSQSLNNEAVMYLERICKAAAQMENLINDLLQYSMVSSLELKLALTSSGEAITKALKSLSNEIATKNAHIKVEDNLPEVLAYKPVLVQVFTNLISNSLKFVKPGLTPKISITGTKSEGMAIINFKDNGIGIPAEKQKLVFEVFERLHGIESYPGTGIGLTIVKKAMERMGGQVEIKPSTGKGCIFELRFRTAR